MLQGISPFLGYHLSYECCPDGFTTSIAGATNVRDCLLPICQKGSYLNSTLNKLELRYKPILQIGNEQSPTLVKPEIEVVKPSRQRSQAK